MCRKVLAILVAIIAIFTGLIWYNVYLPVSPKFKGDEKLIPILFGVNRLLGQIFGDKLGLSKKYEVYRSFFSIITETDWLFTSETKAGVTIEDSVISGVPVKIFRPVDKEGEDSLHPALIYFHGGGLAMGSVNWTCYVQLCIMFAKDTKSVVISVEYRLLPEHPFPTQFDDGYLVVNTVVNEPSKYGIIKDKVALAGDSAGGLLTAAISNEFAKQNRSSNLVGQILIYPWLQIIDILCLPSYHQNKQGFQMDEKETAYFMSLVAMGSDKMYQEYIVGNVTKYFTKTQYQKYLQIPKTCDVLTENTNENINLPSEFVSMVTDPRLSPLLEENLEGCPATMLVIPEYDILASEAFLYSKRLEEAGVPVSTKIYKACHAFLFLLPIPYVNTTIARQGMNDMVNFLNSVFYT
ncbi:arylacetamide deacetylase-like [Dendronephthya gigantea]|uniref:arylacetamide deacetylase-like n=1 Tax=Dendronephthya gigantea TaxID=151771 RepID=UPI00106A0029|nr:arylacetamide deacetylase-like [Dendronephthya gigantea]